MKGLHRYIHCILAIYLALHFAFNGVLLHTHKIDGKNISHSHPFPGKDHTSSEAKQILSINMASYICEETILPQSPTTIKFNTVETRYTECAGSAHFNYNFSRAPPTSGKL